MKKLDILIGVALCATCVTIGIKGVHIIARTDAEIARESALSDLLPSDTSLEVLIAYKQLPTQKLELETTLVKDREGNDKHIKDTHDLVAYLSDRVDSTNATASGKALQVKDSDQQHCVIAIESSDVPQIALQHELGRCFEHYWLTNKEREIQSAVNNHEYIDYRFELFTNLASAVATTVNAQEVNYIGQISSEYQNSHESNKQKVLAQLPSIENYIEQNRDKWANLTIDEIMRLAVNEYYEPNVLTYSDFIS